MAIILSMLKIITLILFAYSFINADNHKKIEAFYDVSYGIFGTLGIAKASIDIKDNIYTIKVIAKATGIAKFFSNGKEETYTSSGIVKNNIFIPNTYIKTSKTNSKNLKKIYTFDYMKNKVVVEKTQNKLVIIKAKYDGTSESRKKKDKKWVKSHCIEDLEYFSNNDLLSLFFNIKQFVPSFNKGTKHSLNAVGANNKNGLINIIVPSGKKYKNLEKNLNIKSDDKFIAQINQDIFSSKKGELFISLNNYGISNKAVLKDVLFFGDIVGVMTDFKIKDI